MLRRRIYLVSTTQRVHAVLVALANSTTIRISRFPLRLLVGVFKNGGIGGDVVVVERQLHLVRGMQRDPSPLRREPNGGLGNRRMARGAVPGDED